MNGASKILTVSYGTFSCTLEGFDDPFNTMKAIAEYFRDLAAEDRYFGAEPPTPDAAMLHRIAEREIQRRVEAKINENGVVLRAGELAAPAVVAPAPAAAPSVAPSAPAPAPVLVEPVAAESVAARLSRLRAEAAPAAGPADDFIEDEHADQPAVAATTTQILTAVAEVEVQDDPVDLDTLAGYDDDEPATPRAIVAEAADDDQTEAFLADLLADPAPVAEDEPVTQDAVIEAAFDVPESLVAATGPVAEDVVLPDLSDLIAGTKTPEPEIPDPVAEVDLGALSDILPEADSRPVRADDPADHLPELVDPITDDSDEALIARLDLNAPVAPEAGPVDQGTDPDPSPDEFAADDAPPPRIETPAPAPDIQEKVQRARARVIHVRRGPSLVSPAQPAATEATLPPDAEADLQRELAALEAETIAGSAEGSADMLPVPQMPQEPLANAEATHRLAPEADDAVERLIAQTNTAMEGPENKRRLSAIAHLKAAVAATLAERLSKGPNPDKAPSREDAYRDDLERAVRPNRPTLAEAPAPQVAPVPVRAAGDRPAPLVLVSEQRIDRPRPEAVPAAPSVMPVRPRRVATTQQPAAAVQAVASADEDDEDDLADAGVDALLADSAGFAEFAEKLGATDLAGMLEAAAAYSSCVEGRPHFSRPQLIRQVAAVSDEELSREDTLRSFGRLLRDGRIVKLRRGQFVLTDRSHILAEAKKIAG